MEKFLGVIFGAIAAAIAIFVIGGGPACALGGVFFYYCYKKGADDCMGLGEKFAWWGGILIIGNLLVFGMTLLLRHFLHPILNHT